MTFKLQLVFLLSLLLCGIHSLGDEEDKKLEVVGVTPFGNEVPVTRGEVIIEFNKRMVSLGQIDKELSDDPVEIKPSLWCKWRWTSPKQLTCTHRDYLRDTTTYVISIGTSFESLDGSTLANDVELTFRTASLGVHGTYDTWRNPTQPIFDVTFTQPMSLDTVLKHLQIRNVQSSEIQQIKVVNGPIPRYPWESNRRYFRQNEDASWRTASPNEEEELLQLLGDGDSDQERHRADMPKIASKEWTVEALSPLEVGATYDLEVAPGAKSIFASEPTADTLRVTSVEAFGGFKFVGLECINKNGTFEKHLVNSDKSKSRPLRDCDPDAGISLLFTSPAIQSDARTGVSISPEPEVNGNYDVYLEARFDAYSWAVWRRHGLIRIVGTEEFWSRGTFDLDDNLSKIHFGYQFDGNTTYKIDIGAEKIRDAFGRTLEAPIEIEFRTSALKPRLLVESPVVIGPQVSPEVPIKVANLRDLRVQVANQLPTEFGWLVKSNRHRLATATDQVIPIRLNLRDWLSEAKTPFVALVTPSAIPRFGEDPSARCIVGQATQYNVWARIGYTSSLVWLTDLVSGQVVQDVPVSLVASLDNSQLPINKVLTDSDGVANLPGRIQLPQVVKKDRRWELPDEFKDLNCLNYFDADHFLRIDEPDGSTIVPLNKFTRDRDWDFGHISRDLHLAVWGHTAQGIYRPEQLVEYKIFVRELSAEGLQSNKNRLYHLIAFQQDELVFHQNGIELNDVGAFHGEFQIPKTLVGTLSFFVVVDNGEDLGTLWDADYGWLRFEHESWHAFDVEVLDFDPATILVTSKLDKDEYMHGEDLEIESQSNLLSGGPYTNAPVVIEASLRAKSFVSQHPKTNKFRFWSEHGRREHWEFNDFQTPSSTTDTRGEFSASLNLDSRSVVYGELTVSLGVQEDSGEVIWDFERAKYRSANRFVGVYHDETSAHVGEAVSVEAVVVAPNGQPKNDLPITLEFYRVLYQGSFNSGTKTLVHVCELTVNNSRKSCTMIPETSGLYHAVATIQTAGNVNQEAVTAIYVSGQTHAIEANERDYMRIANRDELAMREFVAGEVASIAIEHSFPGSQALLAIEQLGILEHKVVELTGNLHVVDIPISNAFAPSVRVSVTVATVDSQEKPQVLVAAQNLEKFPNSWARSVRLDVRNSLKPLDLEITTDKNVYEPGDLVEVDVAVRDGSVSPMSSLTELSVAVVDRGVLEMSRTGIKHYDPIQGLLQETNIDVQGHWLLSDQWRYSYLSVADSEDFDEPTPRANQDLTSFWLPNVEVDNDGTASFEFEVGDRLTEWRIVVVAATATDRFGLGVKSIKTNLGIEVQPVLPNQVTDRDVFDASFSVLNRGDSTRKVTVEVVAEGHVEPYFHTESLVLAPFERRLVSPRTQAKFNRNRNVSTGTIRLLATASSGSDTDALVQDVPVHPRKRHFVSSIYGTSIDQMVAEPVEFPADIADGTGSLEIQIVPSLINALEDRVAQVRDYPYQCWEQRLSSAVVAAQFSKLSKRMSIDWEDASQYIQDVLQSAIEFQSESGAFGYWNGQEANTDLYLSAYTALAFSWLSDAGYHIPVTVLEKLLDFLADQGMYRLPDHIRWDKTADSSLRLMVANALAQHQKGSWGLVSRIYTESADSSLFAMAQSLEAAIELDQPPDVLTPLATRLTNSIGVTGDRALIQHGAVSRRNYMLSSQLKTTCSAISSFVRASDRGVPLISQERLAELVRGVMFEWNRRKFGATPHESSFCLSAVVEYAESMETVDEDFKVDVELVMDDHLSPPRLETNGSAHSLVYTTPLKPDHVGAPAELRLSQTGDSRFYYKATLRYEPAEEQSDRENFGIDIRKAYWVRSGDQWVELDDSHELNRGDVVHVGLYLDIRDQRDFVIVDDPVPGFLQPINLRLAKTNAREIQATNDRYGKLVPAEIAGDWNVLGSSRWGFYNRQLRNDSVRFASDFLPSGRYRLYWSGRVISTGEFVARPAHAEAMYSPEVYGNSRRQRIATNAD
ncbi:MAG: hypothetical protein OXG08_10770 [Gammaproteobacteria bacterium]|nr:hypothetical protein [Gammaproteobacteria bacterium]